jgi:hypothetical protein
MTLSLDAGCRSGLAQQCIGGRCPAAQPRQDVAGGVGPGGAADDKTLAPAGAAGVAARAA